MLNRVLSRSLGETHVLAKKFMREHGKVQPCHVALYGDLGSGKTAFVQGVASALGLEENITSPTFVIEKIYSVPDSDRRLIHIDVYRLESPLELQHLGFDELVKDPRNLIFIEWAEKVEPLLPNHAKRIYFKFIDENTREISFD